MPDTFAEGLVFGLMAGVLVTLVAVRIMIARMLGRRRKSADLVELESRRR